MQNLKIRAKMIYSFGLILALLTLMTGLSLGNIRRISNMVPELYETNYADSVSSVRLSRDLYRMDTLIMDMVLDQNPATYGNEYTQVRQSVDKNLQVMIHSVGTSSDVSTIQSALVKLDAAYEIVRTNLIRDPSSQASQASHHQYAEILSTAIHAAEQLTNTADAGASAFIASADLFATQVIIFQDVLFVFIFALSVATALWLSAGVSRPVKTLAAGMGKIALGQLSTCIENESKDELGILTRQLNNTMSQLRDYVYDISNVLGELGKGNVSLEVTREYIGDFGAIKTSMNQIVDELNGTLSQIKTCCREVRFGASSMATSAHSLAHGAAEQSVALDEFQVSLTRVAELTAQDAKNAAQVQLLSSQTAEVATASDEQMRQMTNSMHEIDDSSKEIAKVIKIIEDIAFQTNILALNAAVEAARAGTAGKGFAVVSDEVRNLASKSAEAAKNTTAMIEKALRAVSGGMSNATASADTMRQVKDCVEQMAVLLVAIDQSTSEQATAFGRMTITADQISAVVHNNSAAAEENSAASEKLSVQAELLDRLIARFRLKSDRGDRDQIGGPFHKH